MIAGTSSRYRRPQRSDLIQRALLVTSGPHANAVAERCLQLSQEWLHAEAPVESIEMETGPGPGLDLGSVGQALDRLADAARMDRLADAGLILEHTDEIVLWFVLDLAVWPEKASASEMTTSLDALLSMADQLEETAWSQLRVRTVAHALLLASPQHQTLVRDVARHLAALCADRIYVSGPVDHRRLRLAEGHWQERTAVAVSAWLWGQQPGYTMLHQRGEHQPCVRAIGAVAWPTPRRTVRDWLAATWVCRMLATLMQGDDDAPAPETLNAMLPPSPSRLLDEVQAGLTRPTQIRFAPNERPPFSMLRQTARRIETRLRRLEERSMPARRQHRQAWIDQHLAQWTHTLDTLRSLLLESATADESRNQQPRIHAYQLHLHALAQDLTARLSLIDEHLSDLSDRLTQAEQICRRDEATLNTLCATIPEITPLGLLQMIMQPWRWPGWVWRYTNTIPSHMQLYLDSLYRCVVLEWEQNNWHTVRQAHLVMVQMVQERLAELAQLMTLLSETQACVTDKIPQALPAPWTPERLDWLYDHLLGDGSAAVIDSLTLYPLSSWVGTDTAVLAERLLSWMSERLVALDEWAAIDFLATALPGEDLDAWLDHFIEEARPLWPPQELAGSQSLETWFYQPEAAYEADHPRPSDLPESDLADASRAQNWSRLTDWCERQEELRHVHSAVDGLIALRWLPVDLSIE